MYTHFIFDTTGPSNNSIVNFNKKMAAIFKNAKMGVLKQEGDRAKLLDLVTGEYKNHDVILNQQPWAKTLLTELAKIAETTSQQQMRASFKTPQVTPKPAVMARVAFDFTAPVSYAVFLERFNNSLQKFREQTDGQSDDQLLELVLTSPEYNCLDAKLPKCETASDIVEASQILEKKGVLTMRAIYGTPAPTEVKSVFTDYSAASQRSRARQFKNCLDGQSYSNFMERFNDELARAQAFFSADPAAVMQYVILNTEFAQCDVLLPYNPFTRQFQSISLKLPGQGCKTMNVFFTIEESNTEQQQSYHPFNQTMEPPVFMESASKKRRFMDLSKNSDESKIVVSNLGALIDSFKNVWDCNKASKREVFEEVLKTGIYSDYIFKVTQERSFAVDAYRRLRQAGHVTAAFTYQDTTVEDVPRFNGF